VETDPKININDPRKPALTPIAENVEKGTLPIFR
jgi:hypothetical protein